MKFLRVKKNDQVFPCIIDENDAVHNVSALVADYSPETLPQLKELFEGVDISGLPVIDMEKATIEAPITRPPNIYCIGLNYSDHAEEAGMEIPTEPVLFNKSACTYCAPNSAILFADNMTKLDWEIELGIVIGKEAFRISEETALNHVLGYTVIHDVSERAWQLEHGGQWAKGKGFPNFCPTGPWIVTGDEVNDARELDMALEVNGVRMQTGNTRTMIFDAAYIVSYLSQFMKLEPGDLICTGTPPGVGFGMDPQTWLKIGDNVTLSIEGLGEQSQTVVAL